MTTELPDTQPSMPATGPLALKSNLVLGPNALAYARARVSLLGAGEHIDTLNRALDERDELAVNLARADEENDKLRELNRARLLGATPEFPENATEPMQKAMQRAVMLRKSMNDVWRAALSELGA